MLSYASRLSKIIFLIVYTSCVCECVSVCVCVCMCVCAGTRRGWVGLWLLVVGKKGRFDSGFVKSLNHTVSFWPKEFLFVIS